MRFRYIHLYNEPSIIMDEIKVYVEDLIRCQVDVRKEFFSYFGDENVARRIAEVKVLDYKRPFAIHKPEQDEIEYERYILNTNRRDLRFMYDGFEIQRIMSDMIDENTLEHIHIAFTNRLLCTFDEMDYRYHYRAVICGYPSIISTSGIVEAPAKPREFYYMVYQQRMNGTLDMNGIKEKFRGRFIDYDDERLTEVAKGYVLQAIFYYITGEPFCEEKECRLYNAHWQEDLIYSQLTSGKLCGKHSQVLERFRQQ